MISIKRVYEPAKQTDGTRFLVDHLWPRGVKKESVKIERWVKEVAPSDALRKWFGHKPEKWKEFQHRLFRGAKQETGIMETIARSRSGMRCYFGFQCARYGTQ